MTTATAENINATADKANDTIHRAVTGASNKKFGWLGCAWRVTTYFLVFVAAMTIAVLGMHYGIAYLAGVGMGALLTSCLEYAIILIGYLASVYVGWKMSDFANEAIATAAATKAEEKRAAA